MKKLSKVALLVCFVAMTTSVFAQKHDYPRYGFWSNWGVGVYGSFNWQLDNLFSAQRGELNAYTQGDYGWGAGRSLGLGLLLEKPISNVWYGRLRFTWPTLLTKTYPQHYASDGVEEDHSLKRMDNHGALTFELELNLIDAFKGWDPNRCFSPYLFAGGGLAFSFNQARGDYLASIQLDGGLGARYKLCESSTIFAEVEADVIGDAPAFWKKQLWENNRQWHNMNFLVNFGYIYNLGVTPADRALAAQRALLTQERFDALNDEAEQLKKDLAEAQANEKKLEGEVADLTAENQRIKDEADARTAALNDSIQGVIDQLKSDQLNYYAIPFSILYPNDVWHVQDSEFIKLEAIARVMKDNPDVKLTIVGFCDYTASDEYNMKLSEKRAKEVKRLLVKKYGVDGDRLEVDWKGKTIAFGDIKFSLNRRVSFYRIIE